METQPLVPDRTTVHIRPRRESVREFEEAINGDYYVLRAPLSLGKITMLSGGKLLHDGAARPGMMRLVSPGERVRSVIHTPFAGLCLQIPGRVVRSVVEATGNKHRPGDSCYVNALFQPDFEVKQLSRSILYVKELDPAHAELYIGGLVNSLLTCLLHHHVFGTHTVSRAKGLGPAEFRIVVDYAEANMDQTLSLDRWAAILGMSAPEFTRHFRVTTGNSPYAWFMQRRIARAKELLLRPKLSLCEVALAVGFSSQTHFTDAFRRRVGNSPARWRQTHR